MNILIIGGSGFVSSRVLNETLAAGHRVWYVTRGLRGSMDGAVALIADRNDEKCSACRFTLRQCSL